MLEVKQLLPNTTIDLGAAVVHSGRARIGRAGMPMVKGGEPALEFGFFVPGPPALAPEDPEPAVVVPEAWLMWCHAAHSGNLIGLEQLHAAYRPDPRGGTARWLLLSGTAYAGFPITIGYRVTVAA